MISQSVFPEMIEIGGLPASGPLAGHGGADYRVRKNLMEKSGVALKGVFLISQTGNEAAAGRPSGRRHPSHLGVWGHQTPSLSWEHNFFIKNNTGDPS